MKQEEITSTKSKSYESSYILYFCTKPLAILNNHTAIINSKTLHFRSLYKFLEKHKKIRFNGYDKIMNILSNIKNCNGKLITIFSSRNNDSIFIRINFNSQEDLEKFDSCIGDSTFQFQKSET